MRRQVLEPGNSRRSSLAEARPRRGCWPAGPASTTGCLDGPGRCSRI